MSKMQSAGFVTFLSLMVLVGAGCTSVGSTDTAPPASVSTSTSTNSSAVVDPLALQAKCAAQAEKNLNTFEAGLTGYTSFGQQNHYNSTLNECFVLINYRPIVPSGTQIDTDAKAFQYPTTIESFGDAYENNELADCTYYGNLIGVDPGYVNSHPEASTGCMIGNKTVTYKEYSDFIDQRMELNK